MNPDQLENSDRIKNILDTTKSFKAKKKKNNNKKKQL